ncbi:MAG: P-loop NTPase fold protein [Maribacter sp.]
MGEKKNENQTSEAKQTPEIKKFESLSPKPVDSESISIYLEALKEGLDDRDVKNLAVTGSYGSGKSSIIRSFQKKYEADFDFLDISLAEFKWEDSDNEQVENRTDKKPNSSRKQSIKSENFDKLVELSILQQIFYKVRPAEVPDSRLKRIRSISHTEITGISIAILTWFIATFALIEFDYLKNLNPSNWKFTDRFDWFVFFLFLISITGLFLFLKKAIRWLHNTRIDKVNVKGVELGGKVDESILNKHLDEILYFFEKTSYDVVVIEDLDRQEELGIFTKLREINYLLNNSKQVISKNRNKVTFIYAVRDDILKEKDRTKFFDLVVPVIPFINSYNSNDKLRERLLNNSNKNLAHPITEEFIDDVSLYIDDMRLLLNICNEYEVYKENLNKNLKQNNILALVVYKNMRPKDFVKLHNRKGNLFSLLSRDRKNRIIEAIIESIETEQSHLRNEIENIEKERLKDAREINSIYLYEIRKAITTTHIPNGIYIGDEAISISNLEKDFYFQNIKKDSPIKYTHSSGAYNANMSVTFNDIENLVSSELTYEKRVENISTDDSQKINQIEHRIDFLESKKIKTNNWNLETIFREFKTDDFLSEEERSDRLMKYFLRNGYIDENYQNYISYFYEVSLSREDNEYLISVTSESPLSYDFEIKNIKNVIKRIQPRYFEKKAILNFDLFSYILKNKNKYKSIFDSIFTYLTNSKGDMEEAREKFGFINSYLKKFPLEQDNSTKKNVGKTDILLNEISKRWENLWGFIERNSGLTKTDRRIMLKYILSVVNDKNIKSLNADEQFVRYIESLPDFLSIPFKTYQQKFATVIQILGVKFSKLEEPNKETMKLFDFVYENNNYKINDENIAIMVKVYGLEDNETSKIRYNYTDIVNSQSENVLSYIDEEINSYVEYSNEVKEAYNNESEKSVARIYNNKKLKEDLKHDFLKKQTVRLSDLSKINEESDYPNFFNLSKIVPNWHNVSLYFYVSENSIDEILKKYLNDKENYNLLSSSKIVAFKENKDDDLIKNLSISLIKCDEISIESYSEILKSIPKSYRRWNSIGLEEISKNKVLYLIKNGFLSFSESNFTKIFDGYSDLLVEYLIFHQYAFVSNYDKDKYVWSTIHKEGFFKSDRIVIANKIKIFEELEKSEVVPNANLSSILCDVLANYGYDKLDFEFLQGFFSSSKSTENRIKLFNLNHEGLVASDYITLIKLLPYPYYKISEKQNRPKIANSKINIEFVKILESNFFISSYKVLESTIRVVARY